MSAHSSEPTTNYVAGPLGVLEDFRLRGLPKWFVYIAIVAVVASWVPLAVIYRARFATSTEPRIHIFQDMDNQPKFRPQDENPMFADGRAMRPVIAGTVSRGAILNNDEYTLGFTPGADAKAAPVFINGYPKQIQDQLDNPATAQALLLRGQQRFNIYCATCHGADAQGAGIIHVRADQLVRNGVSGMSWVQPKNLHEDAIRQRQNGHIFNTITNGIRNMGGLGSQIQVEDRWAIVAYVRTLQFSAAAKESAVPAEKKDALK